MTRQDIENEIAARAEQFKPQTHIVADYYRIRRKLAYPLPIREMILPNMPVPGIATYPWSIWVLWDLEERVNSLGWSATWLRDDEAMSLVRRDVQALCDWPCYRQYERPDLSLGHCSRLLWMAYMHWPWLGDDLMAQIEEAFERIVLDALLFSDEIHGSFESKEDILALDEPHSVLHNIPLIGTVGITLAAHTIGNDASRVLDQRLHAIIGAILDLREGGHSEGVGYDGYIMDFVVHWLQVMDESARAPIVGHPRFGDLLEESVYLGAPGHIANVAEIGDVEPLEMPFHMSAQAKLLSVWPNVQAGWYLKRCQIDWLKADALGALHGVVDDLVEAAPEAGAKDAHYAVCLRSGWNGDDVAVAMSVSNSPMGHLQKDTGTLVIGSRGRWLIDDPGYQQYMKKTEREFTLSETAHNVPVINGQAQAYKQAERTFVLKELRDGICQTAVDLTACYAPDLNLKSVKRTVWLKDSDLVVVADCIDGEAIDRVDYYWHGHPDAGWWVADCWAQVYFPDVTLWFSSPQAQISDANVDRLPGSRGQLTLCAEADKDTSVIWWIFGMGDGPPKVDTFGPQSISVNHSTFDVG